jgi:hypothetical protein
MTGSRRIKLLRTIRLDASDTFVFPAAARPGEWAVPGTFMFWETDPAELTGRDRQAFRAGFLGVDSFGWSTLAVVVEASEAERDEAVLQLATGLVEKLSAPSIDAARLCAAEEIAYAEELAQHPEQTLVALHRKANGDGSVAEQFRTFHAADAARAAAMPCSAGAIAIVDDDGEDGGHSGDTGDNGDVIDLAALLDARKQSPVPE